MANRSLPELQIPIESLIVSIRGTRVILDSDLAKIYGVTTKALNQAVKRNSDKFPHDFMFQLVAEEVDTIQRLRSQIVTLKRGQHMKYAPFAFTEHGAIMAANVLRSPSATQMSVFVVRAFVNMRNVLTETGDLARKLAAIEKKLTARIDNCDRAIVNVLQEIMRMLNPPSEPIAEPAPKRIGFGVKEPRVRYGSRREEVAHV